MLRTAAPALARPFAAFVALLAVLVLGCREPEAEGASASASATAAPKQPPVSLEGVDTSGLTPREHQAWSDLVKDMLAPCKDVAVPVAECVEQKRECSTCLPAAEFLLRQVQSGLPKEHIAEVYEARFHADAVKNVEIGRSASKGPPDAPVVIVEFADFECPACGVVSPMIEHVFAKFDGKVRVVFKHFPLPNHPNAKLAAQATFAAQKQGQFWRMHKMLFENQMRLTEPDLVVYAEKIGLDVNRFKKDLHSEEAKQWVERERKQGDDLGVDSTPTLYVNGRRCDLSKLGSPLSELERWIELELKIRGEETQPASTPSAAPPGSPPADR